MTEENEIRESESRSSTRWGSSSGLLRLKKIPDTEVMNSIQVGVRHTVGALDLEPERDLLIQDFMTFESVTFPTKGSNTAPPHSFVNFKFLNYAPIAFKCFRGLFKIKTESFLDSMCSAPLRQLENPGASGSIFYLTHDDAFILKTVQQREADFLLKLLPGYYLNLTQNPRTLLPKFFGFYCYATLNTNTRIVAMNNLIPSNVPISEKYDLKGSTSKRKATQAELKKPSPTFKDLDFLEHHPNGLFLDFETYATVTRTLERDCRVLESFKIIDYSLLLAVHYVDKKPNLRKFTCNSLANKHPTRGIPARTATGEDLLLFIGIIDILQSYQLRKKIEHSLKSIIYEKDSISVHRPDFYNKRFQNFLLKRVFQPMEKRKAVVPKVLLDPEPSCSSSLAQEDDKLTLAWACSKSKYSDQSVEILHERNYQRTPLNMFQGNHDNEKKETVMKEDIKNTEMAALNEKKENDIELQAENIIAKIINDSFMK